MFPRKTRKDRRKNSSEGESLLPLLLIRSRDRLSQSNCSVESFEKKCNRTTKISWYNNNKTIKISQVQQYPSHDAAPASDSKKPTSATSVKAATPRATATRPHGKW